MILADMVLDKKDRLDVIDWYLGYLWSWGEMVDENTGASYYPNIHRYGGWDEGRVRKRKTDREWDLMNVKNKCETRLPETADEYVSQVGSELEEGEVLRDLGKIGRVDGGTSEEY